jgi:hypothetical protein
MSEKDRCGRLELLLPNFAYHGVKGEANEEVDEQAGIDLKQAVLGQREMTREQHVDQVAQEDGEQGLEEV